MLSGLPPFDPREADRLLKRLLELPPDERTAALEDACNDDALRAAVRALLDGAAAPHGPFDPGSDASVRLWSGLAAEAAERESPLATGAVLGSYRILGEIARGGMAVVYRAERIDGELSREVAIKVLKLGLDTEEVVLRFEQERQILADLEHPGIARLYDAGRTSDGRPYFVMELVKGLPIDRYSDERRLSIDARLELFRTAVAAVEYAHQNLVVHRDLKPSNILITEAGEVKLLDFGIARLVAAEAAGGAAPATRTALRMMTPEYASPEQVRGERVTTASDVYQLGLLLYELLSGQRAYLLAEGGLGALERAICEEVPTRPSTAVARAATWGTRVRAGAGDSPAGTEAGRFRETGAGPKPAASGASEGPTDAVFRARRSTPARLRRRLRGDLDNIVLKALRKEPERRYPTADRLAQDIRRHLIGLPVTARPDTWRYRGRKFLRRHALGASAAVAVLVLAIGSGAFYTVRIRSERDRAEAERAAAQVERDRARVALAKAERMSGLLAGLFRSSDPRQAHGADLTARELLDRGVDQVESELAEQPLAQAEMLQVLGRTYMELGLYGSADRLFGRALDLRRGQGGAEQGEVAETLADIGLLRERQGHYEEAQELLEEAWRIYESSPGTDDDGSLSELLVRLAMTYRRLGEHDEAGIALERALSIQDMKAGQDTARMASTLTSLGLLHAEMGSLDRAEQAFRRSLRIREERLGEDDPQIAWSLMNLASAKQHQGRSEGVESMYRRSLAILENAYGADRRPVNIALNNLGQFLVDAGRADEAIEPLERSLEIAEQAAGPRHPETAFSLASLAEARFVEGRVHEARQDYERCVTIREAGAASRPFDPLLIHCLVRLGRIEAELGDSATGARRMTGALAYWRNATERFDPQLAPALVDLARWLAHHDRCPEAVPIVANALRVLDARYSPHPVAPEARSLLTTCAAAE